MCEGCFFPSEKNSREIMITGREWHSVRVLITSTLLAAENKTARGKLVEVSTVSDL